MMMRRHDKGRRRRLAAQALIAALALCSLSQALAAAAAEAASSQLPVFSRGRDTIKYGFWRWEERSDSHHCAWC